MLRATTSPEYLALLSGGTLPFVARAPAAPLDAFVKLMFHATSDIATGFEWVVPSGGCQLVIRLDDRANRWLEASGRVRSAAGAAIGGPFLAPVGLHSADTQNVAGALFEPGGLAALLGHPVRGLRGDYVDATALIGRDAEAWLDPVRSAVSARDALHRLETGLTGLIRRRSRRSALQLACRGLARGLSVGVVASQLGASQRRFSSTFRDETGLTPKQFTRLSRFQRAMAALREGGLGDLATLARQCGFTDQAHLNHEFRAFAAMTPTEVVRGRGPFTNHVHVRTSGPLREP